MSPTRLSRSSSCSTAIGNRSRGCSLISPDGSATVRRGGRDLAGTCARSGPGDGGCGSPGALLLVDASGAEFLAHAHALDPRAARMLLVERDYSSTSPAVEAIALGRADYHFVRPWTDDETMYRAMSEALASWERERAPNFELFRIVAAKEDGSVVRLRDVMTRFSMAAAFYQADVEAERRLLDEAGVDAARTLRS
jgi:hypothetical protein